MATKKGLAIHRIILALLLIAGLASDLGGQAVPHDDLVESQRRLDQMRREGAELREEMTQIRSRVSDLSSELSNLDRQVSTAAGLAAELEYQADQRESQIERNTYELLMTRDRLTERRAVLLRRLRDIYKRGPLPTIEVLLAAESFSDLLNRYRYLFLIARNDRLLAEEVADLENLLIARERALRSNLVQLANVRSEHTGEHEIINALLDQQRAALASVRSREDATAQRIAQIEADEASLAGRLSAIETERRASAALDGPGGAGTSPASAALGPSRMGTLDWPVLGTLLYGFGRVVQLGGETARWNGIGIGAPAGSPVAAVEGGRVVLAGPVDGYGPTVVISHGGGYYTLYLYLREIAVTEGQQVVRGRTLGTVGGQSVGEGPHIEFQIRLPGGQAADPLNWLRRR